MYTQNDIEHSQFFLFHTVYVHYYRTKVPENYKNTLLYLIKRIIKLLSMFEKSCIEFCLVFSVKI